MRRRLAAALTAAMLALTAPLLSGCAQNLVLEQQLFFEGGWVKSAEAGGMTGVFGTLQNGGDDDLTIESAESDAAETVELHEITAAGVMQQIDGEVVIPAKGSYELAPGANHIMLMGLTNDLKAGDSVTVTLHLSDGSSQLLIALVKDYAGANEEYHGSEAHDEHAGH